MWMELIKDYDVTIQYYLGKANVVVDALTKKIGEYGQFSFLKRNQATFV